MFHLRGSRKAPFLVRRITSSAWVLAALALYPAYAAPLAETPPPPGALSGESCQTRNTGDPGRYCLAVKYVVYKDDSDSALATPAQAVANFKTINRIWGQCGIQFEIEDYEAVSPRMFQLQFRTSSFPELDQIRSILGAHDQLLIVTTGTWSGVLGAGKANAWTTLPGGNGPFGAILERPVGTYPNIIAHELGHYLNLSHATDALELMNPVIYERSTVVTKAQCQRARAAVETYWSAMLR